MKNFKLNKLVTLLKKSSNFILITISIAILTYFCINNDNLINLLDVIPRLNIAWIALAFASLMICWIIEALIVKRITNEIYHKQYPKLFFFKVAFIGQYFNSITPMGIAGQPMQILELSKCSISKTTATIITTRKFFIYQSCLALYSVFCSVIYYNRLKIICPEMTWMLWTGTMFQCSMILIVFIFYLNKNIILKISEFFIGALYKIKIIKDKNLPLQSLKKNLNLFIESNKSLSKNKKVNFEIYILTFFQITFLLIIPFFVFKAFHHNSFPVIQIICAQSIINTISSFTPLPGAAGTAEKSFMTVFSIFFTIKEIGKAMLLSRFISCYFTILIGTIFSKKIIKSQKN